MDATKDNVGLWLDGAPDQVRRDTERLLGEVERLRQDQVIYPAQDQILRALELTAPNDVRVVILGQDPYHEPGQAMGLSFSVPAGQRLPPSLRNVYKELSQDLGCEPPATGDLTPWARQGVLLLNTTLTVREHAANSHVRLGWQSLTNYLVRHTTELPQPICYLAWGRHAATLVTSAVEDARLVYASLPALRKPRGRRARSVHGLKALLAGERLPCVAWREACAVGLAQTLRSILVPICVPIALVYSSPKQSHRQTAISG